MSLNEFVRELGLHDRIGRVRRIDEAHRVAAGGDRDGRLGGDQAHRAAEAELATIDRSAQELSDRHACQPSRDHVGGAAGGDRHAASGAACSAIAA